MQRWPRDSLVGRVMGAGWAALLILLAVEMWDGAAGLQVNLLRVMVVAAFAATYVAGWFLLSEESFSGSNGFGHDSAIFLGALLLISVLAIPVLGEYTLMFLPFAMAAMIWLVPMLIGVPLGLGVVICVIIAGQRQLAPFGVMVATCVVMVTCTIGRLARDEGIRGEELRKQQAMIAERERVARDVHDVLGHSLTAISVKAELAHRLALSDPEAAAVQMAEVHDLSRAALAEVRETVAGLRVARLDDELAAATRSLTDAGIEVTVNGEVRDVDPRHRIVAAWALRELVTNVIRHSRAEHCIITLRSDGVEVYDDGVGLQNVREGNGLRGVRERVVSSGGSLEIADRSVAVVMGSA